MTRLKVSPDSELGGALRNAARSGDVVTVEAGDEVYQLAVREERGGSPSSAESDAVARSIEGIKRAAGGWKGLVDAETFKSYVAKRRRAKNRQSVRW